MFLNCSTTLHYTLNFQGCQATAGKLTLTHTGLFIFNTPRHVYLPFVTRCIQIPRVVQNRK